MKFLKISSNLHLEKLASTCAVLDLTPYNPLHPPPRSWLVANHTTTHSVPGPNFQRRRIDSFGPPNPLICSFQTIKEDAEQLHSQSAEREGGICPLAWENWSKCNKTRSSSIIIPSLHKSQEATQAAGDSSYTGISAGGEKLL